MYYSTPFLMLHDKRASMRPSLLFFLPIMIALGVIIAGCTPVDDGPGEQGASSSSSLSDSEMVVYFGNDQMNPNGECNSVYPVARAVYRAGKSPLVLLRQLFAGPTPEEMAQGYTSFFSDATKDSVRGVALRNGTAYVNLADIREVIPNASSSCGSASLLAQIEETLMQLPGINRVIIAIEGDTQTFYDWIQIGCGEVNDDCDNEPFSR